MAPRRIGPQADEDTPEAWGEDAPEEVVFDLLSLTNGELSDMADATGLPFTAISLASCNATEFTALYWVFRRRVQPGYTYAAARALPAAKTEWKIPERAVDPPAAGETA